MVDLSKGKWQLEKYIDKEQSAYAYLKVERDLSRKKIKLVSIILLLVHILYWLLRKAIGLLKPKKGTLKALVINIVLCITCETCNIITYDINNVM